MWQSPTTALADSIGADPADVVVVAIGDWTELRRMQTKGGEVKFTQRKDGDGDWVLVEFFDPEVNNWYATETHAMSLRLPTPEIAWAGPVGSIPDDLLEGDLPLQVRRVDKAGWINLRMTAKEACEAQA